MTRCRAHLFLVLCCLLLASLQAFGLSPVSRPILHPNHTVVCPSPDYTDWELEKLHGQVAELDVVMTIDGAYIPQRVVRYNRQGMKVKETLRDVNGVVSEVTDFQYNDLGKISRIIHTDFARKRGYTITYQYDAKGRWARLVYEEQSQNPETRDEQYQYDASGNLAKILTTRTQHWGMKHTPIRETDQFYYKNGVLAKWISFDKDGKARYQETYAYDAEKRLVSYTSSNLDGKGLGSTQYFYQNGLLTKTVSIDISDNGLKEIRYFDAHEHIIKHELYTKAQTLVSSIIRNQYDGQGNLVEQKFEVSPGIRFVDPQSNFRLTYSNDAIYRKIKYFNE